MISLGEKRDWGPFRFIYDLRKGTCDIYSNELFYRSQVTLEERVWWELLDKLDGDLRMALND